MKIEKKPGMSQARFGQSKLAEPSRPSQLVEQHTPDRTPETQTRLALGDTARSEGARPSAPEKNEPMHALKYAKVDVSRASEQREAMPLGELVQHFGRLKLPTVLVRRPDPRAEHGMRLTVADVFLTARSVDGHPDHVDHAALLAAFEKEECTLHIGLVPHVHVLQPISFLKLAQEDPRLNLCKLVMSVNHPESDSFEPALSATACAAVLTLAKFGPPQERAASALMRAFEPGEMSMYRQEMLMIALGFETPDVARALIHLGAQVNEEGVDGWTALDVAQNRQRPDMVAMLREFGGQSGSGV